jgi:hypothetical protein
MGGTTRKRFEEALALDPEATIKVWAEDGLLVFREADGSIIKMEVDEARNFASQILSVATEAEAEARAKQGKRPIEDVGSDVIVVGTFRDDASNETVLSHVRIEEGRVRYTAGERSYSQSIPEFMSLASGIYGELADILNEGASKTERSRPARKSRIIR